MWRPSGAWVCCTPSLRASCGPAIGHATRGTHASRCPTEHRSSDGGALESSAPRPSLWLAGLLLLIAALALADLALDGPMPMTSPHLWLEVAFVLLCLVSAGWLGRAWLLAEGSLAKVRASLVAHQVERDLWRRRAENALHGLGAAIDDQFTQWQLTPAEKETALLLLKGLSHREVASVCGRSERTVRQHAIAVYRKSGLAGRAELSACFLEDLMLPAPGSAAAPPEE